MFNQNSPIVQNMINTGQFGIMGPQQIYNPYGYQNNMIPIGQINYTSYPQNNFVFQPTVASYDYPQQQPMNVYQPVYQQPQYNYYDPYGTSYNYNNYNYGYLGSYGNPYQNPYNSPAGYQKYHDEQIQLMKIKFRIAGSFFNKEYTEEELDQIVNPQNPVNMISDEERMERNEFHQMKFLNGLFINPMETNAQRTARCLRDMSYNFHKEFDNHSLCQFLEEDLWKLQREQWISKYIKRNATRDLSGIYSSADYNELLNMHKSSNPYINELLDTSRYDNNLDDMEIGIPFDANRRANIFEGKIPTFISSEETQKRRNEFTNQILDQIYSRGGPK